MIISNCVVDSDDNYEFDLKVTKEETEFLVDFAVRSLIQTGLIKLALDEAEQELDLFKKAGGNPS